jgi:hypothetical protein
MESRRTRLERYRREAANLRAEAETFYDPAARAILDGHQPTGLTATQLIERADLPMSWREQRRTLGFA